jgi:CarboxypepD_reg-like domain
MANFVRPEYNCSQKDLYSILETAWANYSLKQTNFTAHKAIYNPAFKTTALAAIAAAKALPDDSTRSAVAESIRINLVKAGKTCLLNFQFLKSYIETAFSDKLQWPVQYKSAGGDYYREAAQEDWESMELLNQSAKNYLANNNSILLGIAPSLNMPATFTASLTTAATSFSALYLSFKSAEETSALTAVKINANNACYRTMTGMLKDGQVIFANDLETRKLFAFKTLWELINPPVSGVKGKVKVIGTNEPISGAMVSIQKEDGVAFEILTDDLGDYSHQVSAGKYTISVIVVGYVSQSKEMEMKSDGYRTLDWIMMKL